MPLRLQDVLAEDLDLLTSIATKYQANQAMAAHVHEAYSSGRIQRLAKQQADAAAKGAGGGKARKEEEQEAVVARCARLACKCCRLLPSCRLRP